MSTERLGKETKTYNSGYSAVFTDRTTSPLVHCLNRAEQTESLVSNVLWWYVKIIARKMIYKKEISALNRRRLFAVVAKNGGAIGGQAPLQQPFPALS